MAHEGKANSSIEKLLDFCVANLTKAVTIFGQNPIFAKHMPKESLENRKKRVQSLVGLFKRYYPDAHCALHYETPEQLLFATILSAQCTDERVNMVTPYLFEAYPTLQDMARAKQADVERIIQSTGFFRNKAKSLIGAAQALVEKHKSEVPKDLEALVHLPGVGRKTANVVLGNAYGIASGVVVDTHVKRLSQRLGLVKSSNPEIIERELVTLVAKRDWVMFSHWLISHGRAVCKARKPACEKCFAYELCPRKGVE